MKAGVFAFDGYHMQDADGNLYGYGIEVLELISKYSHLNFDLVGYEASWSDMLGMLERGEIDVVTSASKTPEREEKFDFSLPIGKKSTVLSVNVNNDRFISGNYHTYDGIIVGEIPGNTQNDIFAEFANDKGFGYTVVEFDSNDAMEAALQNGDVDAILTSDLRKTENEKTLESIEDDDYYAIVRKGDTELLNEINYAIEQMNISEGDWKNTLFYKYYGPSYSNQLEFNEREKAYIEEVRSGTKRITATVFADRKPYSYVVDGQLEGILVDYFSTVMDVAGLPFELVIPKSLADYEKMIEEEQVNVVIDGATGESTDSQYFDEGFSTDVFMDAGIVGVMRNDFSGEVNTIAVSDSSTGTLDEFLIDQGEGKLVHYRTREDALQAVLNGEADCTYVYVYTAQEFVNRDLTNSLSYSSVYGLDVQFNMRISANTDHELVNILNKCIKQVPAATLNSLIADYTAYTVDDLTVDQYLEANPMVMVVLGLIVVIIIAIIAALLYRGVWNKRLIDSQERSNRELKEQLSIVEALSRDYTNVFSIDEHAGAAKVVKLEGYVTEGLSKDPDAAQPYMPILETYVSTRVHPDDRAQLLKELSFENVRAHLTPEQEYVGTYRVLVDGEVHHFQYTYVMVEEDPADGESVAADEHAGAPERRRAILAGFRNIDEAVRKEQEQKEALSEALAQAQYANQAKTTFLNNMSHDIRTPMNAIIGFTALADTHIDDTEQVQNYLGKIMTSSNHLLSLINEVLDMSRIESGKVKIDNKETDLTEVIRDLCTIVQADITAKGLEFSVDMLGVTDASVICDKLRLSQVLLNILSNAIKYTEPGGSVSMRITESESDERSGSAQYRFIVKDTGIGMGKQFLEHVFEPFEREETATVSGIQGTGLGLAITKNIVGMMGGTIEVSSEEGVGSEFVVTFRFDIFPGADTSRPPEETADLRTGVDTAKEGEVIGAKGPDKDDIQKAFDSATEQLSGLKVLLAEDNEMSREIAKTILEDAQIVVDAVEDGKYAVERMKEQPAGTYDVVLTDVQMPIMNGYETTRAIRALDDPEKASIPIIAVTANAFEEDREEAEDAGMSGYVPKPIDIKNLFEVLSTLNIH